MRYDTHAVRGEGSDEEVATGEVGVGGGTGVEGAGSRVIEKGCRNRRRSGRERRHYDRFRRTVQFSDLSFSMPTSGASISNISGRTRGALLDFDLRPSMTG